MKDYLRQQVEKTQNSTLARCVVSEYMQARLLQCLQDSGAFETWAFVGGTALRFLYGMPRFSEDLDFSLSRPAAPDAFVERMKKAKSVLADEGYVVHIKAKDEKNVKSAFVKLEGLLFELGLSPHPSEVLSVKVELDTNPPAGARLETSIIRRHCLLNLQHYDKSSLLAGKLHALLSRRYVKGRDMYDLVWYLSDRTWPEPNLEFLNNALQQTGWTGPQITEANWRKEILERISQYDWTQVVEDVSPFLERPQDVQMLTQANVIGLLHQR
jgi:predicted nucleotidyltransferase component of viral defense system